jgi:hypothetical protein
LCRIYSRNGGPAIKIVLDLTRLVAEGKLTAQEADRLQALARRDTGSLAINVLMSFGAVAVAAGIIALEPAFTTGAALGVALVAIGVAISFFAAEQWGLLGTATTIIGALLLAGGVIGLAEADFAGLAFSALLFLTLAVAIRSNFLIALVPLALAGALGSSTGYRHAVYMLTVNEPSITIAFFALLASAAYLVRVHKGVFFSGKVRRRGTGGGATGRGSRFGGEHNRGNRVASNPGQFDAIDCCCLGRS